MIDSLEIVAVAIVVILQIEVIEAQTCERDLSVRGQPLCPANVECGRNAGVRTIRVQTGFDRDITGSTADWTAKDLPAAAQIILDRQS